MVSLKRFRLLTKGFISSDLAEAELENTVFNVSMLMVT